MSLRVAVQMDPLDTINIAGDSSFALMVAAQDRGHALFYYDVGSIAWEDGKLSARAAKVTVRARQGDHFDLEAFAKIDLEADVDVILMRQDPPFDLGYISAALLLDRLKTTLVVNDPREVVNAPEKMFVLDFQRFMPPTLIARQVEDVAAFHQKHGDIVIKPLHGNGGKDVFRIGPDGANLSALVTIFGRSWPEPLMAQKFLPEISMGDKRIVLIDGDVAGAINRIPGKGDFRSNLAQGGSAEKTRLTDREREICSAMGPALKERGLVFVGIDVIGGKWLTEINVTSPTGIVAIDAFDGSDTSGMIWDAIERRQGAS